MKPRNSLAVCFKTRVLCFCLFVFHSCCYGLSHVGCGCVYMLLFCRCVIAWLQSFGKWGVICSDVTSDVFLRALSLNRLGVPGASGCQGTTVPRGSAMV